MKNSTCCFIDDVLGLNTSSIKQQVLFFILLLTAMLLQGTYSDFLSFNS